MGDVEICLLGTAVRYLYEMKNRQGVTVRCIEPAVTKIARYRAVSIIHLYPTEIIEESVANYAVKWYEETGARKSPSWTCIGFTKHFCALCSPRQPDFLNAYQEMVMTEPDSAVSQRLKRGLFSASPGCHSGE